MTSAVLAPRSTRISSLAVHLWCLLRLWEPHLLQEGTWLSALCGLQGRIQVIRLPASVFTCQAILKALALGR